MKDIWLTLLIIPCRYLSFALSIWKNLIPHFSFTIVISNFWHPFSEGLPLPFNDWQVVDLKPEMSETKVEEWSWDQTETNQENFLPNYITSDKFRETSWAELNQDDNIGQGYETAILKRSIPIIVASLNSRVRAQPPQLPKARTILNTKDLARVSASGAKSYISWTKGKSVCIVHTAYLSSILPLFKLGRLKLISVTKKNYLCLS